MRRLFRATALMVILFAAKAAVATISEGNSGELRDIRGPSPPSGLPPFTASTALVVLAAAGMAISRLNGTRNSETLSAPASGTLTDELLSLRNAYEKGELPDWLLFDRLSPLVRAMLPCDDHSVLTSGELVAAARGVVPEELLNSAGSLLELCDTVRFGSFTPGKGVALRAVDDALQVVRNLPERSR